MIKFNTPIHNRSMKSVATQRTTIETKCTKCNFFLQLGSVKIHDPNKEEFFVVKNLAVYLDEFIKSKSKRHHACPGFEDVTIKEGSKKAENEQKESSKQNLDEPIVLDDEDEKTCDQIQVGH